MDRAVVKILGLNVDTFSKTEALDYISSGHVVTINPEIMSFAQKDEILRDIINSASLVIPDGIGVELALRINSYNVKRIPGIEFGKSLIEKFANQSKKIAFIGAKPDVAKTAADNLSKEISGMDVCYIKDGYFKDDDSVISDLKSCEPDLILVAMGSPRQEYFISKLKQVLPESLMIGLGGSFDVWSGNVERAPELFQKLGLEWLYRTIKEPYRIKRIFPALPLFLISVLNERICFSKNVK